ncbi:hypothetical protein SDC9_68159 [bioreactor metagenome]|uniref:Uncharacterized protein n=1 Tax=bioreactor metagenome TaxID=1076179 RepID=A0A644Y6A7_9ZZZZ
MLNTIASVKRVMGLIPVFAALIRSFITRVGQEHGGNFVRHLNKAIGGIIRVVVPKIDRCHLIFPPFRFWMLEAETKVVGSGSRRS